VHFSDGRPGLGPFASGDGRFGVATPLFALSSPRVPCPFFWITGFPWLSRTRGAVVTFSPLSRGLPDNLGAACFPLFSFPLFLQKRLGSS